MSGPYSGAEWLRLQGRSSALSLLVGQITARRLRVFSERHCRDSGKTGCAEKPILRGNSRCTRRSTAAAENFSFVFAEIVDDAPIPPRREGRTRGRHDMRGGDAVAVLELQRDLIAPTNNIDTDVKSCGPGIPVLMPSRSRCLRVVPTTGARQPVPEEITYKR
jgi:hypothetical protein